MMTTATKKTIGVLLVACAAYIAGAMLATRLVGGGRNPGSWLSTVFGLVAITVAMLLPTAVRERLRAPLAKPDEMLAVAVVLFVLLMLLGFAASLAN